MKKFTNELLNKANECLEIIHHEESDILVRTAQAINLLEKTLLKLKTYTRSYLFVDEYEEIRFFKEIKPQIFSKLIYHRTIYSIEVMRPNGSREAQSE